MFQVIRKDIQNDHCQWAEIHKDGKLFGRVLIARTDSPYAQTDREIISDFFESRAADRKWGM